VCESGRAGTRQSRRDISKNARRRDQSSYSPDETADGEAELEFGGLRQSKTVGDDDGADVQDELDRLQDVE